MVSYQITTRCHNLEERELNLHHRENLRSRSCYLHPVGVDVDVEVGTKIINII